MRLLFVADGRSPIALNWIEYFLADRRYEVHLASTFPCVPDPRLVSFQFIPLAFSGAKAGSIRSGGANQVPASIVAGWGDDAQKRPAAVADAESGTTSRTSPRPGSGARRRGGLWSARLVGFRTLVRQALGPLTLPAAVRQLRGYIQQVQPELVHAMRIPFEGMLAASAVQPAGPARTSQTASAPRLLCSVWGNDFTLHARSTPWMGRLTRQALQRVDALHADCYRDVGLAHRWGFAEGRPAVVLPGAGGIQEELFYPPEVPVLAPVVIQPRGFRAYVDNETFFHAIPLVLRSRPEARFLCPTMAGDPQAQRWIETLDIPPAAVDLLPQQPRPRMAELFRSARVIVSPATHDGTPNTLLEAMACGCLPVAGDLESLREWITPGVNGLLVDLGEPEALAQAILLALEADDLLCRARPYNARLIAERAAYRSVMAAAEHFYASLV